MISENNTRIEPGDLESPLLPEMVSIPAGVLLLGTSDEQVRRLILQEDWAEDWHERDMFQSEQPQQIYRLPDFEISRFPITNVQYHAFVWETGHRIPRNWDGFRIPENLHEHPAVEISKQDASAYCKWLSGKTGSRFRLPTEPEWERAARGDDDRNYPWGPFYEPFRANTSESKQSGTTPVGTLSPGGDSPYGVADLCGNVWEWTSSLLKPYPYKADDGRERLDENAVYVVRGGSWYYSHKLARCSSREGMLAGVISPLVGFRIVRNAG
ncbi:MAG: SUMF1/EgtB/PvdO family nonheme iron enzyme [Anaerolineales bacterium]|nr:SUMF1/EgtB/PvdO family nonheme iron enzyme [Anaerolineales bacterium]